MADNLGIGVSRTLDVENRSWDMVVWKSGKPILDSELNITQQIIKNKEELFGQQFACGFLDKPVVTDQVSNLLPGTISANGSIYGSMTFLLSPCKAFVAGRVVDILFGDVNGGIASDQRSTIIRIGVPNVDRQDLVFLECWEQLVLPTPATLGKPSADKVYPYGNTQWADTTYLPDDLQDPSLTASTTSRVQMQYRIRMVEGVDFLNYPNGVDCPAVLAQGGKTIPSSGYTFGLSQQYKGLYVAGDETTQSQTDLGTVNGLVYALPIARIQRRNTQPFSPINLNGASKIMSELTSDRPDGLFNDEINILDIEDLRHYVSVQGFNADELLRDAIDSFHDPMGLSVLRPTQQVQASQGVKVLQIDDISPTDEVGMYDIFKPNAQRRIASDQQTEQPTTYRGLISDKYSGTNGSKWISGDKVRVAVGYYSPAGTIVKNSTPTVSALILSGGSLVLTSINGTWSGLGTDNAVFTLGTNDSLTNQDLIIDYTLIYPFANGISYIPEEVLKVYDPINAEEVCFTENGQSYRERQIPTKTINGYTDQFFDVSVYDSSGGTPTGGVAVQWYYLDGANTNVFTIPNTLNGHGVINVYQVWDMNTSPSPTLLDFTESLAIDNSLVITLGTIYPIGKTLKFVVALQGQGIKIHTTKKAIEEYAETMLLTRAISSVTSVTFDMGDMGLIPQGRQTALGYSGRCFLSNSGQNVTWTIDRSASTITATFGGITSGVFRAYVTKAKTLDFSEKLHVYYMRRPYQGIFTLEGEANTFTTSPYNGNLKLKTVNYDQMFQLSCGTGGYIADLLNNPTPVAGYLEKIPFRFNSSGYSTAEFSSQILELNGYGTSTDYISQSYRNTCENTANGNLRGFITFNDLGTLSNLQHMSGMFVLTNPVNHVNCAFIICQVIDSNPEYKIIPGEFVLLVLSHSHFSNVSADINWLNNPTNCIWDVFTLPSRPLG